MWVKLHWLNGDVEIQRVKQIQPYRDYPGGPRYYRAIVCPMCGANVEYRKHDDDPTLVIYSCAYGHMAYWAEAVE